MQQEIQNLTLVAMHLQPYYTRLLSFADLAEALPQIQIQELKNFLQKIFAPLIIEDTSLRGEGLLSYDIYFIANNKLQYNLQTSQI